MSFGEGDRIDRERESDTDGMNKRPRLLPPMQRWQFEP